MKYKGAIMGFLAILCSIQVLHAIDGKIYSNSRILWDYLELDNVRNMRSLLTYARSQEIELSNLELISQKQDELDMIGLITTVRVKEW
jgi:hypothetical protein